MHILSSRVRNAAAVTHAILSHLLGRPAGSIRIATAAIIVVLLAWRHFFLTLLVGRLLKSDSLATLRPELDGLLDLDLRVVLAPQSLQIVAFVVYDLLQALLHEVNATHHMLDLLLLRIDLLHVVADRGSLLQHLLQELGLHLLRVLLDEARHHDLVGVDFFRLRFVVRDYRGVVIKINPLQRAEES